MNFLKKWISIHKLFVKQTQMIPQHEESEMALMVFLYLAKWLHSTKLH